MTVYSVTSSVTAKVRLLRELFIIHSALYYALMQIVITICNPPSLTAGGAQRR